MVKERPLRDLLSLIEARKPFALSRWGDREWHAVFGECDGHIPRDGRWYFGTLSRELGELIASGPPYMLSLPSATLDRFSGRVEAYIESSGLAGLHWCRDAFRVDDARQLQAVVGAVSRVQLVVVGPPWLRRAKNLLRWRAFVDVPPRNQYLCRDDIVRNVLAELEEVSGAALVTVQAGVVGPLLIDDLYRKVGHRHQVADVGDLWLPFAGR